MNPNASNNSNSNRKYLTSTGMLLKTLAAEDTNNSNSFIPSQQQQQPSQISQQYPQQQQQQQMYPQFPQLPHHHHLVHHLSPQQQQQQQSQYHHIPMVMPSQTAGNYLSMGNYNQPPQPQYTDVTVLPNSTSQQRWQPSVKPKFIHEILQPSKSSKQIGGLKKSVSQSANLTQSIAELPETFGLPSNNNRDGFSSYKTSTFSQRHQQQQQFSDILIDDTVQQSQSSSTTTSTVNVLSEQVSDSAVSSTADIEIISESYPSTVVHHHNHQQSSHTALANQLGTNTNSNTSTVSESFKAYLAKNYPSSSLAVAIKPQSNFMSNLACVNHALSQLQGGYYENKMRRFRPYSSVKLKDIESIYKVLEESGSGSELKRTLRNGEDEMVDDGDENEDDEDDEDGDGDVGGSGGETKQQKKLKTTQIIVIDDQGDDIHKPWITPELINLIKHRNLLQAKINENEKNLMSTGAVNGNGGGGEMDVENGEARRMDEKKENESATASEADVELIKKFKNLRNKVTKLVKKARKEYLAKYIKEGKQNASTPPISQPTPPIEPSNTQTNGSTSINKQPTVTTTTSSNTTQQQLQTTPVAPNDKKKEITSIVTEQLVSTTTESLLKNHTSAIMSLYNTYYAQYMQNYAEQQKKAQAANESGGNSETLTAAYDALQKQAAVYAQQQAAVQEQLHETLKQSVDQLVQEVVDLAAGKQHYQMLHQQQQQQQPQMPGYLAFGQYHPHPHHIMQQQQQQQMQPGPLLPVPSNVNMMLVQPNPAAQFY